MHSSKGGNSQKHLVQLSASIAQGEKSIDFEQHRIFQELKSAQHVEINQYQTVMAIMTSNMKLYIYDALTKNQICEMNLQEFIKIDNSVKQSALGKSGDVLMRFLKNTNFLSVYLKNSGDFLVLKIGGSSGARVVQRMQLQEKLSFMEMDPCSKNGFIFGSRGIEMGNLKTQKIINIEQGSCTEVRIVESSEDMDEEIDDQSSSTDKEEINEEEEEKAGIDEEDEDELDNGSEEKQDNKNKEQEEEVESDEDSNNDNNASEKDNSDDEGEDNNNSNGSGQDKVDYVVEGLKKLEDNVIEDEQDDGNDDEEEDNEDDEDEEEDKNQDEDDENEEDGNQVAESNRSICINSDESELLNTNEDASDKDDRENQKIATKQNMKEDCSFNPANSKVSKKTQRKQVNEIKTKQNKQQGKKIKGRATPPQDQSGQQYDQHGQINKVQENNDEDDGNDSYQTNSPKLHKKIKPNNKANNTSSPLESNLAENKIGNNIINHNNIIRDIPQTQSKDTSKSKNVAYGVPPPVEISSSSKQVDSSVKIIKNISSNNAFSNKLNAANVQQQQAGSRTQANSGINLEKVETKLLDSSSVALYLRDRCSKNRKVIIGMVNRRVVIYEVTITESDVEIQLINKLELPELHMYDMSVLQLSLNLQNDKFALAIDRKFLHLFSLDSTYHIATFSEDYINIDQNKRYSNPLFWRDPYEKDKPEYFIYMDNTNLNCSIVLMSLRTAKRQIVILEADKPRNVFQNVRWEGCIGVVGEGGGLFVLETPRQYYWENFSYRFKGLEKNSQYIEREDEFDVKDSSAQQMKILTLDDFDNLKTNYTNYLYPQQNKIISQGTIVIN